jgi:serine protease Do
MARFTALSIAVLIAINLPARGGDKDLGELLALEDSVKQAVKSSEPSIACILVTRDRKAYTELGQGPSADEPGRLGDFRPRTSSEHEADDRKLDLADPEYTPECYGSGVIVSARNRLVLTNYHVVRDAAKIYVHVAQAGKGGEVADKGSYANIYAADPRSDLAVLQLIDEQLALKEIRFGDAGNLKEGQFVAAMSYPFADGFRNAGPSTSFGVISNLRRPVVAGLKELERSKFTLAQFGKLIQINSRLSLGCSGGAVVNLKGEMIGITNALAALTGVETPGGFALPMDDNLRAIVDVLKRGEEVEYGFLGVSMRRDNKRAEAYQIEYVIPNSPAERASLRAGDYIVSINGERIHDSNDLFFNINIITAGSVAKIELAGPNGTTEIRPATLVKAYVGGGAVIASQRPDARKYGGLLVDYSSVLVQSLSERRTAYQGGIPQGVMIREVLTSSPAAQALLQPDKLITKVNGEAVNLPREFYAAMDRARKSGKAIELEVTNLLGKPYTVKLDLQ